MKAYRLKVNGISSPVGIDIGRVCLSWLAEDGVKQTAYRVKMEIDGETVYDSGRVESSEMSCKPDVELPSRTVVSWSVALWDENGAVGETLYSGFETTIAKDEWKAKWIDPEEERPQYCYRAMDGLPLNRASY